MKFSAIAVTSVLFTSVAHALPWYVPRDSSFLLANGEDAIAQNAQFATLTVNSSCTSGTDACVNSEFAQCVNGAYLLTSCGSGLICAALPLVNSAGTSITCTTEADLEERIAATGATSASNSTSSNSTSSSIAAFSSVAVTTVSATASATASAATASSTSESSDAQSSLTLLDSLVNTGFSDDGTNEFSPEAGEIASATSTNNFINFCATVSVPLTNGTQVKNGSCNAAPMGMIASTSNMPSAKFVSPANLDTIAANSTFNVTLAIERLQTGHFVNPDTNFFAAPQTVNTTTGDILGHSHVVIEQLTALNQTTPTDPGTFAFFKGLNSVAVNGQLTVEVTGGLPAGVYRMASINAAANHQPVLVAVAQHGSLDDMVYFTVQ